MAGESEGLALMNLNAASVQSMASANSGDVMVASLAGGEQPVGIYRSDDRGRTWHLMSSGPGIAVDALAIHPTQPAVVYAGTAGGPLATTHSLWRSENGGETWYRFPLDLPANAQDVLPSVSALAVDPQNPDVLYVGTDGQGVYRIDVRHASYQLVGTALYNAYVKELVVDSTSRVYAITNEGLFVTAGEAWQKIESVPELPASLAIARQDPGVIYVGSVSTGAYRSTDAGRTWQSINAGLELIPGAALRVGAVAVDPQAAGNVVAATAYGIGSRLVGAGIYQSHDAGETWTKVADTEGIVTQLKVDQGMIYAGTSRGLARYGQSAGPAASALALPSLVSLANPTAGQVLIMVLTLALAGLILVGRLDWLPGRRRVGA
jgi:photosystem II stability/assembly factor-like uncharacterized protein